MKGTHARKLLRTLSLILSLALGSSSGHGSDIDFGEQILPVLAKRCGACHQGPNAQKGMRVSSVEDLLHGGESGPALVPSDPDASLILSKVGARSRRCLL